MTRPLSEPSFPKDIARNRWGVKEQRQKPLASRWVTPDCDTGTPADVAVGCFGDEPALQNNWQQAPGLLEKFAFRIHMDGSLEFKGHLDASGGAVSGTVAVTLPGANPGEADYLPPHDFFDHTVITDDGGTTFQIALVFVDASSGDLTITWPAT